MKPVRIQLSRKKGFNLQSLSLTINGLPAINVARPTKWGNPFRSSTYSQQQAVDLYRTSCMGAMPIAFAVGLLRNVSIIDLANAQVDRLAALPFSDLRNRNLACWCRAGEPCHADVLLELANVDPTT